MEFVRYSSIENTYRDKAIDACHQLAIKDWVALEKVDGANFSFIVNEDNNLTVASRNGLIEQSPDGFYDFFGCTDVVNKYAEKMKKLSAFIGKPIRVYGELYGSGIQKRIPYGDKDFIIFDIQCTDGTYLPWKLLNIVCREFNLPVVKQLAYGTLNEMLQVSPEFTSVLCDALAEGLVIKPADSNLLLSTGSRPILKHKSKAFSETKSKVSKPSVELDTETSKTLEILLSFITTNRLHNVLSKFGEVTQRDFGKVLGLLIQDALEDFHKDFNPMSKEDWQTTKRMVNNHAAAVVRQEWSNII